MIFEMMFGVSPFYNPNRAVLYEKIKHSRIIFPDKRTFRIRYTEEVVDIISKLLNKNKD